MESARGSGADASDGNQGESVYDVKPAETGQLQYISQLVMMSGTKREEAWVCLKKLIGITDEQEQRIRGALERMRNPHPLNNYIKKRGRPVGQTNKPGHCAGRGRPGKQKKRGQSGAQIRFSHNSQGPSSSKPCEEEERVRYNLVVKKLERFAESIPNVGRCVGD